jgi:hypothetical protein
MQSWLQAASRRAAQGARADHPAVARRGQEWGVDCRLIIFRLFRWKSPQTGSSGLSTFGANLYEDPLASRPPWGHPYRSWRTTCL